MSFLAEIEKIKMEEKIIIKNRREQKIVVLLEKAENQKGLAFVMHGLSGFKEQEHIKILSNAFLEKGFTAVRFDTTNTLGESGGKLEHSTITNSYEDLEDVINWSKSQPWYQEPFALAGHSQGGISVALYAEKYPKQILALAPISSVVSGKLSLEAHEKHHPGMLENWEKTGWRIDESRSKPGTIRRLPWSHIEDRLKYDLLPEANKLTMPILMIVGENDDSTPPDHMKKLYDLIPGKKEFHIINGAPHTFRDKKHLDEIKGLFIKWIDSFAR